MKDLAEIKAGTRSQQCMNVVWHHHPCDKLIPLPVKVFQGAGDDLRDCWLPENAGAMARVQPLLDLF